MLTGTKNIANKHYLKFYKIWLKMRDVLKGEEHIKNRSLEQNAQNLEGKQLLTPIKTFDQYLRPTDSMRRLGELGLQRFCDYIYRAKFYPFPLEIQNQSLGLIENQTASIELPTSMESMLSDATTNNESLLKVLSIVNTEQLSVSRVGLLLTPSAEDGKPFNIGIYKTEAIVDWVEALNSDSENIFAWIKLKTEEIKNNKHVYLILTLDENENYIQYKTTNEGAQYGDDLTKDSDFIFESLVEPKAAEKSFNQIPFVIINLTRLGTDIEIPFLESVADSSLSLYRASAHHEDALYWGGESTLFTQGYGLGNDKDGNPNNIYVGNGAVNKTGSEKAAAYYATMGIDGIAPREKNATRLFEYCVSLGVDLLNKGSESGVALNIRSNVKTASLKTLSLTGALGLESILKFGASWLNLNNDEVTVQANTKFADTIYTAEDFVKFSSLVALGAMREQDLFKLQKTNDITSAASFDDWKKDLNTTNNTE